MPLTDALGFWPEATSTVAFDESGSHPQTTDAIRTIKMLTAYRRAPSPTSAMSVHQIAYHTDGKWMPSRGMRKRRTTDCISVIWQERQDSNPRPLVLETSALARLSYAPASPAWYRPFS